MTLRVENPPVGSGGIEGGRYLRNLQVKDGRAYLAYWKDGLVTLDAGVKGREPRTPTVRQLIPIQLSPALRQRLYGVRVEKCNDEKSEF
ncbi:MAG: hypothetical protein M3362_20600 [Acidobacteriota bacterium]|nr:hypothetical protein [Acidobacteriota bacterium]